MRPLRRLMEHIDLSDDRLDHQMILEPVQRSDLMSALQCVKPSSNMHRGKYEQWQHEFGATTS